MAGYYYGSHECFFTLMNRYLGPDNGMRTVLSLELIALDVYNSPTRPAQPSFDHLTGNSYCSAPASNVNQPISQGRMTVAFSDAYCMASLLKVPLSHNYRRRACISTTLMCLMFITGSMASEICE